MKAVSDKFARTLGVSLVGLLAFLLLTFFIVLFFSQHGGSTRMGSARMMDDSMGWAPSASISAAPVPMMAWDGAGNGMMEKSGGFRINTDVAPMEVVMEQKVVKNGTLHLQVGSIDTTVSEAVKVAREMGGMVADSYVDQSPLGTKNGSLTVKVAVSRFDEAMARLKGLAVVVVSENTSAADVTEQVIDLQARINNKKAAEATLQSLFEQAVKVSDVIEITDRLTVVRSEIESLEGQMRYLDSQTNLASIVVFMTEDVRVVADQGFRPLQTLKESLMLIIGFFGDVTQGLIRTVVVGVPALLVNGAILWILYRVVRTGVTRFWPGSVLEKRRVMRRK